MLETRVAMTLFAEHLAKRKCDKDEIRQERPELSYILGTVAHSFQLMGLPEQVARMKQPHPMLEKLGQLGMLQSQAGLIPQKS